MEDPVRLPVKQSKFMGTGHYFRAREPAHPAMVRRTETGAEITLPEPTLAAPGQACVFYHQDRVLGGGFILAG